MPTMHDLVHIALDALIGAAIIAGALFARWSLRDNLIDRDSPEPTERLTGWIFDGACAAFALGGLLMAFGVPGAITA